MKNLILLSALILPSLSFAVTADEYDQRFHQKLGGYFKSSEVTLSLTETQAKSISVKACQKKVKKVLTFTGFRNVIDQLSQNERKPVFQKVDKNITECLELGTLRSSKKSMVFSIAELMDEDLSVDLSLNTSYIIFELPGESKIVSSEEFLIDSVLKGKSELALSETATLKVNVAHAKAQNYKIPKLKKLRSEDPLLLIDVLSRHDENATLFAGNAGVSEGYTIKEHTLRVLEVFNSQYNCGITPEFEVKMSQKLGYNFKSYLRFLMSLHDLGKSRAVDQGKKYLQHEFILPVLQENFKLAGYNPVSQNLAETLMHNDVIGNYLTRRIDVRQAVEKLKELAAKADLSLEDYFLIQKAYYTFDAGSYPLLGDIVFKEDEAGCMQPKAARFEELQTQLRAL